MFISGKNGSKKRISLTLHLQVKFPIEYDGLYLHRTAYLTFKANWQIYGFLALPRKWQLCHSPSCLRHRRTSTSRMQDDSDAKGRKHVESVERSSDTNGSRSCKGAHLVTELDEVNYGHLAQPNINHIYDVDVSGRNMSAA